MRPVDPPTWSRVSPLLDRALDVEGDDRASFLAEVRAQQPELAPLLEDLLREHEQLCDAGFLESPPPLSTSTRATLAGTVIGNYTLDWPLGVGGMGSVWHAQRTDGLFEGAVAVKLLHLAALDAGGEERFRREGTLLARLSHPHIARLFDAGLTSSGQPYLVLEYIEGARIDRYADEHRLDVRARLDLFQQVADAVTHAHAHLIVHRDLKPSNVLVDNEGHVKLLDFGIAKLLDADAPGAAELTKTGSQAWTPAYAAPEQVRGESATTTTDVYALGVLLYELLVETHPTSVGCTTAAAYLTTIVDVEPVPASAALAAAGSEAARIAAARGTTPETLRRTLTGDLDTILATALQKEPARRYASVKPFVDDVRRYLRGEPIVARPDRWRYRTRKFLHRHRLPVAALAGIVVAGAAAIAITIATRQTTRGPSASSDTDRIGGVLPTVTVPITSEPGEEGWPAFSPDSTRLAFAWLQPKALQAHIAIKTIGPSAAVTITDGPGNDMLPVWSPDGLLIAFLRSVREPELMTQVCLVPAAGGPVRVLHAERHLSVGLAWWEQGNALVFATRPTPQESFRLGALDLKTLRMTMLTSPPPPAQIAGPGDRLPAISPNGRLLAFARDLADGHSIYLLDLVTREERRLTFDPLPINGLTWQQDGNAVILSAVRNGVDALYRAALSDGAIVRLPQVDEWAKEPAVGRGGRLAFSRLQNDSNIYRADLRGSAVAGREAGAARPIIVSSRGDGAPHISPDGQRIAFESSRSGGLDIWVASADGANPRQLTFMPRAAQPRWSPDGRLIAFGAAAPGQIRPDVWVVDANGGTPRQLTADASYDTVLEWSADGTAVYFRSDRSGGVWEVWRVPVGGGAVTQVTMGGGLRAQESRDGAFLYYSNDVPEIWRRALRPSSPGTPDTLVMALPREAHWGGDWVVRDSGIYYLNEQQPAAGPTIELLPFRSAGRGKPIRILSFPLPPAGGAPFMIAPDESWLAWSQEDHRSGDIMMLERVP